MDVGNDHHNEDPRRRHLVALFATEFDAVYRFSLARCGNATVAEDIASETFHAAANALTLGQEETIGRSWLFVVARRRMVDHWRRAERDRRRVLRVLELGEAQGQTSIEQATDGSGDAILAALASLPPRQRFALTLRYLDDRSVAEVAETMDLPYRTVESLLARGRKGFIKAWEAQ